MTCSDIQELLDAYIDEELPLDMAKQVRRHLASCAACATALADLRRLAAHLDAMPGIPTPAHLALDTLRRFRRGLDRPGLADWWRDLSIYMRGAACGIALAGLIFGVFMASSLSFQPETATNTYIASIYHTEGILP